MAESVVLPNDTRGFGSGFPPDVIETTDTRLGRRGFTPVPLSSNTPLQRAKAGKSPVVVELDRTPRALTARLDIVLISLFSPSVLLRNRL